MLCEGKGQQGKAKEEKSSIKNNVLYASFRMFIAFA